MLFMVIERFGAGMLEKVADRFQSEGRLLPDGVAYQSSWMTPDGSACYQVMETPDEGALRAWTDRWIDLVEFEVVPVQTSTEFWATRQSN